VMIPRTGRLAELARRDVGDRGNARGELSAEYHAVQRQVLGVAGLISGLVLATVVLMALHVGG